MVSGGVLACSRPVALDSRQGRFVMEGVDAMVLLDTQLCLRHRTEAGCERQRTVSFHAPD
jgi:hypothetical protein